MAYEPVQVVDNNGNTQLFTVGGMPNTAAQTETSATTAAGASINATVPAVAGKTSWITGFDVTLGTGTAAAGTVTVTGLANQLNYVVATPAAGANVYSIRFAQPIPASAVNAAITVTVPAIGGASAVNAVNVFGYQN